MHLNVSFLFLLLGITLIQAGPAAKIIEKKSLAETVEAEAKQENLNIEESGEEKDRTKKAALYFQIQPNCQQPVKENLVTVQNIPLRIQAQSVPPQIHTLNVLQPIVQTLPQPSIIIPQQPIPNLHIAQHPAQPSSAVNVIQSSSNTNVIHGIEKQQPQPKPKPTPAPVTETVPVTEKPKPMRIEQQAQPLPKPQETLALLPMAPTYEEHLMFIPEQPQFVPLMEVPATTPCTNPLHNYLTSCTCSNVRPLAMNMVPVMPYPSAYARSSMMMPHMVAEKIRVEPQGRTNTHIDLNIPNHRHHHPHHHSHDSYQNMYVYGSDSGAGQYGTKQLMENTYASKGVSINTFPAFRAVSPFVQQPTLSLPESTLRNKENTMHSPVASEASNLIQTNKSPRETNTNQLSPEKMLEIKQEQSQAMLIDGRRNVRSNKEKSKERKSESTKN
ncbi:PREDICTED: uncharacterized protein LOC108573225 [Habropoda laboriosa]|uniref:uncharacterized protein LOC108573225 n=1 Tax=Habropoda laboriosa TaxID=597456 RepID=UPI00083D0C8B|nr:PREDICTED: uncharacterized protein LOC108573225 [Habropoda laboriosa]